MEEKLPRWCFVKVYLNKEELDALDKLCETTPRSEYLRGLLKREAHIRLSSK